MTKEERKALELELWREKNRIRSERTTFMQKAMEDYDENIHYPAVDALQERCENELGHDPGSWHNNGLGRCWRECTRCGEIVEEEYYEI
jgi:hypothetical protein